MNAWVRWSLVVGICFSAGCGSSTPPWRVVSQARPNRFTAQTHFSVPAPTYEGATVDGASVDALASQPAAARAAWIYDFTQLDGAFRGSIIENAHLAISREPAPGASTIQMRIVRIATVRATDPGDEPHMDVEGDVMLLDAEGHLLDEIVVDVRIDALVDAELAERRPERFRKAGIALGKAVAKYLRTRTGLE